MYIENLWNIYTKSMEIKASAIGVGSMKQESSVKKYEKTGYLQEPFRLFHLKDSVKRVIDLHYHDFYKMLFFYSGNVTYMIEGKSYVLEPGDVVLVNRNDIHKPTVDFSVPYERSIFYISAEYMEQCRTKEYDPFFCFTQAAEHKAYVLRCGELAESGIGRLLARMEQGEAGQTAYGWQEERLLLFQLLLLSVNRMCMRDEGERTLHAGAVYNPKIVEILTYVREHLFEDISIDDLADEFYISKYHMMRQFKNETGYTIHRYITEKRIAAAKEKLLAGMPAAKVSEECGFQDYSTFLRAFQSCVHMTPTAFAEARKERSLGAAHNLL